jgi:hypothetical protein
MLRNYGIVVDFFLKLMAMIVRGAIGKTYNS